MIKLFIILILLTSCGTKNKVDVSGKVQLEAPENIEIFVIHKVDPSVFSDVCEIKYQEMEESQEKEGKVQECKEKNAGLTNQFIDYLNNTTVSQKEE